MKIYSWNVNGMRAVLKKNYYDWFNEVDADIVCLQETKAQEEQIPKKDRAPEGYASTFNASKVKKGYSGTACFYKDAPQSVSTGLPDEQFHGEGRSILMEYDQFYLFNIYFPNGQKDDERLQYKLGYYDAFLAYAQDLRKSKPVMVCGDFNTAHAPIDLARPKQNEKTSGFLPIERAWLDKLVDHGYVDCFRLHNNEPDNYTWWSYRANARANNVGWRIDYFFVSNELKNAIKNCWIEADVTGSDHCPIGLELAF